MEGLTVGVAEHDPGVAAAASSLDSIVQVRDRSPGSNLRQLHLAKGDISTWPSTSVEYIRRYVDLPGAPECPSVLLLARKASWAGLFRCRRSRYQGHHPSGGQSWECHLPSFRADDRRPLYYLCDRSDGAPDERGAATSDRARFQPRQARDRDSVRGRSSHGRRFRGRAKRTADVRRCPEIDRETPCRRPGPAPPAQDRPEKPVDRISGRRHLRGRHPAHRSRCRPGICAEQHEDGEQADIGIQKAVSLRGATAMPLRVGNSSAFSQSSPVGRLCTRMAPKAARCQLLKASSSTHPTHRRHPLLR